MVEAVSVHNVKSGEKKKLDVNGVFLAVGTKPNSELFANLVKFVTSKVRGASLVSTRLIVHSASTVCCSGTIR